MHLNSVLMARVVCGNYLIFGIGNFVAELYSRPPAHNLDQYLHGQVSLAEWQWRWIHRKKLSGTTWIDLHCQREHGLAHSREYFLIIDFMSPIRLHRGNQRLVCNNIAVIQYSAWAIIQRNKEWLLSTQTHKKNKKMVVVMPYVIYDRKVWFTHNSHNQSWVLTACARQEFYKRLAPTGSGFKYKASMPEFHMLKICEFSGGRSLHLFRKA